MRLGTVFVLVSLSLSCLAESATYDRMATDDSLSSNNLGSDLTWAETYTVPVGELWIVEWISPYAVGEITPMYDLRVLDGEYEILNPALVDIYVRGDTANLFALSGETPAVVRLFQGAQFDVANDILQFRLTKKIELAK